MANEYRNRPNRLYRDPGHAWIAGVCAGIAKFFDVSRFCVRLIALVCLFVVTVPTMIVYGIAWMILDKPPEYRRHRGGAAQREWREVRSNAGDRLRNLDRRIQDIEARVTASEFDLEKEFRNL
ncbi:MAG: PspC domain-containing protein [Gammaproteobacteria bacterium]|nr:MAG: PspC domain-containing protein [Gammaproteobacteria bacterium]